MVPASTFLPTSGYSLDENTGPGLVDSLTLQQIPGHSTYKEKGFGLGMVAHSCKSRYLQGRHPENLNL
jgi:hypothetical protein